MRRITEYEGAALAFAGFYALLSLRAWWDFTHPRAWATPGDDPHVYVWAVAVGAAVCACVFGRILLSERRARRRAEVRRLLARAEGLLGQKRLAEAEACLNEAKALGGRKGR